MLMVVDEERSRDSNGGGGGGGIQRIFKLLTGLSIRLHESTVKKKAPPYHPCKRERYRYHAVWDN